MEYVVISARGQDGRNSYSICLCYVLYRIKLQNSETVCKDLEIFYFFSH